MDNKEIAITLAIEAYEKLKDAGIPEQFIPMLSSISSEKNGSFFGSFGSDAGFFIEFQYLDNSLTPVRITFGTRRYKPSVFSRFRDWLRESWEIFYGRDSEYYIDLTAKDVTSLKDLLRFL